MRIPKSKRNKTALNGNSPDDVASLQPVTYVAAPNRAAHQFPHDQQDSGEEDSDDYLANYIQVIFADIKEL